LKVFKYHSKVEDLSDSDIRRWDQEFLEKYINQNNAAHVRLLEHADRLNVPNLFNLLVKAVADKMKGKSPEEIRLEWDICDDLSQNEKDSILNGINWFYKSD
jgi:S-phase kinase-associated protein 1